MFISISIMWLRRGAEDHTHLRALFIYFVTPIIGVKLALHPRSTESTPLGSPRNFIVMSYAEDSDLLQRLETLPYIKKCLLFV